MAGRSGGSADAWMQLFREARHSFAPSFLQAPFPFRSILLVYEAVLAFKMAYQDIQKLDYITWLRPFLRSALLFGRRWSGRVLEKHRSSNKIGINANSHPQEKLDKNQTRPSIQAPSAPSCRLIHEKGLNLSLSLMGQKPRTAFAD